MKTFFFREYDPNNSYQETMDIINKQFKIECLRDMGDDKRYTVYKSDDGGLFYVFYQNKFIKSHCIYMSKSLYYSDFKSIKIGDDIEKVVAIDSAATKWASLTNEEILYSKHLLKDGLLVFTYKNNNGTLKITDINFSKDFIIKNKLTNGDTITYDYHILKSDYPG